MMRKKLVVGMLCILLVFTSSACGASSSENQDVGVAIPTNSVEVRNSNTSEFSNDTPYLTTDTSKPVETEIPQKTYEKYQVELDYALVKTLPEVPDISEMDEAIASEQVPNEFQSIYAKKALAGELKEDLFISFCIDGSEMFSVLYKDGVYSFNGLGVFQKDGTLVLCIIQNRRLATIEVFADGKHSSDTVCLDFDKDTYPHLELLDTCSECSVCYDTLTSQFVCMKNGKEAGKRVDVSLQEVLDFKRALEPASTYSLDIGYLDSQNKIIYPIVQNSPSGISFCLYSLGTYVEQTDYDESEPSFHTAEPASGVRYRIYNSVFYTIPDELINYMGYMGFCCAFISVNTESVEFTEHHVVMSNLVDITLGSNDGWTDLSAYQGNIQLWGGYTFKGCFISDMIENHIFEEYIQYPNIFSDRMHEDTGLNFESSPTYFCPTWSEALKIIEYSNTPQ